MTLDILLATIKFELFVVILFPIYKIFLPAPPTHIEPPIPYAMLLKSPLPITVKYEYKSFQLTPYAICVMGKRLTAVQVVPFELKEHLLPASVVDPYPPTIIHFPN